MHGDVRMAGGREEGGGVWVGVGGLVQMGG